MKILFICVANSARSQMAEGIAKKIFGSDAQIQSAGSNPSQLNPLAIEALQEMGIDISGNFSKTVDQITPEFLENLDFLITLCAEEVCPILISNAKKLHWPLPDPAGHSHLSADQQLERFRAIRDQIQEKLIHWQIELEP